MGLARLTVLTRLAGLAVLGLAVLRLLPVLRRLSVLRLARLTVLTRLAVLLLRRTVGLLRAGLGTGLRIGLLVLLRRVGGRLPVLRLIVRDDGGCQPDDCVFCC